MEPSYSAPPLLVSLCPSSSPTFPLLPHIPFLMSHPKNEKCLFLRKVKGPFHAFSCVGHVVLAPHISIDHSALHRWWYQYNVSSLHFQRPFPGTEFRLNQCKTKAQVVVNFAWMPGRTSKQRACQPLTYRPPPRVTCGRAAKMNCALLGFELDNSRPETNYVSSKLHSAEVLMSLLLFQHLVKRDAILPRCATQIEGHTLRLYEKDSQ